MLHGGTDSAYDRACGALGDCIQTALDGSSRGRRVIQRAAPGEGGGARRVRLAATAWVRSGAPTTTPCSQQTPWGAAARCAIPPSWASTSAAAHSEIQRDGGLPAVIGSAKPGVLAHGGVRPQRCAPRFVPDAPHDETTASSCLTVVVTAPAGRTTTKVAPLPGALSAQMVPPWASTMRLQM